MTKRILLTLLLSACLTQAAASSEVADKFAQLVPNFASQNIDQKRDAQQEWQTLVESAGKKAELKREIIKLSVDQLQKENPAETTIWLLRQLGIIGDASAVSVIAKFLNDKDIHVQEEAARALANIPDKAAAAALKKEKNTPAETALISKEHKQSDGKAADKNETEFPLGIPYASAQKVRQWLTKYDSFTDEQKAATLNALAVRIENTKVTDAQEPSRPLRRGRLGQTIAERRNERQAENYVKYAEEGVKSSNPVLRNAALLSFTSLGSVKEVPFLLEQAYNGANKGLAINVLSRISGQDIDAALIAIMQKETDDAKFIAVADILKNRSNKTVKPVLLSRAKAAATPDRLKLLQSAEPLSSKDDVGEFVEPWSLINDAGQKQQAEQIIARLAGGNAAPVLAKLTDKNSDAALSLLGRISDAKTLDAIKVLPNKLKALANWDNAAAADDLFAAASDEKASEADKITALRAFVRVISLPPDKLGINISVPEQTARLEKAFALAKRDEDKQLIIQRAGQVRAVESLRFVLKSFDDAKLQETVCGAILDLAHHVDLKKQAKDEFIAALDKVLSVTQRKDFKERAARYKEI